MNAGKKGGAVSERVLGVVPMGEICSAAFVSLLNSWGRINKG